jgi:hypothetical protein
VSALAVEWVSLANIAEPLRPPIAFWFLLVCPGMAYVRLLRLKDSLAEWTIAIALSLALDAAVAGVMLFARAWSPGHGLIALIVISLAGALLQLEVAYGRVAAVFRSAKTNAPERAVAATIGAIILGVCTLLALLWLWVALS